MTLLFSRYPLRTAGQRHRATGRAARRGSANPIPAPVLKLFNPIGAAIWIATELAPDDDALFGAADLGFGAPRNGVFQPVRDRCRAPSMGPADRARHGRLRHAPRCRPGPTSPAALTSLRDAETDHRPRRARHPRSVRTQRRMRGAGSFPRNRNRPALLHPSMIGRAGPLPTRSMTDETREYRPRQAVRVRAQHAPRPQGARCLRHPPHRPGTRRAGAASRAAVRRRPVRNRRGTPPLPCRVPRRRRTPRPSAARSSRSRARSWRRATTRRRSKPR